MQSIKRAAGVSGLFLLMLAAAISCNRSGRYIMSEKKFVDVLVDMQLADGMGVESLNRRTGTLLDSASLYTSVFEKHGVTRAIFDSTMTWYTLHTEDFVLVYNKVISRLNAMETELDSTKAGRDTAGPPSKRPFVP
jgi:hypothetical protein